MPAPLNTPPVDLLEQADAVHTEHGYDFSKVFDHYFKHEYVFKAPNYLILAGDIPERPDAWFVWWAEMHPRPKDPKVMLRVLLKCIPYHRPWIGWARMLKGRQDLKYYSTDRLIHFTQKGTSHAP